MFPFIRVGRVLQVSQGRREIQECLEGLALQGWEESTEKKDKKERI